MGKNKTKVTMDKLLQFSRLSGPEISLTSALYRQLDKFETNITTSQLN